MKDVTMGTTCITEGHTTNTYRILVGKRVENSPLDRSRRRRDKTKGSQSRGSGLCSVAAATSVMSVPCGATLASLQYMKVTEYILEVLLSLVQILRKYVAVEDGIWCRRVEQ
jgi:hypothetical protein